MILLSREREPRDYHSVVGINSARHITRRNSVGGITVVNVAEGTLYRILTHACYKAFAHRVHACDKVDGIVRNLFGVRLGSLIIVIAHGIFQQLVINVLGYLKRKGIADTVRSEIITPIDSEIRKIRTKYMLTGGQPQLRELHQT